MEVNKKKVRASSILIFFFGLIKFPVGNERNKITSFTNDLLVKIILQKLLNLTVLDRSGSKLAVLILFASLCLPVWWIVSILAGVTRVSGIIFLGFIYRISV